VDRSGRAAPVNIGKRGAVIGEKEASHRPGFPLDAGLGRVLRNQIGIRDRQPIAFEFAVHRVGRRSAGQSCTSGRVGDQERDKTTKNKASETKPNPPAMRANISLTIGLLRSAKTISLTIVHTHERPRVNRCTGGSTCVATASSWRRRHSPSRDDKKQSRVPRPTARAFKASRAGTNMTVMVCHGGRPSFPSPPCLAGHVGAADMPIGCALIFCWVPSWSWPGQARP